MKKRKMIVPTLALGMVVGGKLAGAASDKKSDGTTSSNTTTLDPFTLTQVPASSDVKATINANQVNPSDNNKYGDKKSKKN